MRERVRHRPGELIRRAKSDRGHQQRTGFKGRVLGIGKIENRELRARCLPQPALQEGRDR